MTNKITERDEYRNGVARLLNWYGYDLMDEHLGWQLWADLAEYFTHE